VIWYLPTCASQTWAYIEATLVHELVHVLLDGIESHLPSKLGDTAEHVVEGVARAFLRTRKAGG
jgi:hypothetical protein